MQMLTIPKLVVIGPMGSAWRLGEVNDETFSFFRFVSQQDVAPNGLADFHDKYVK